MVEYEVSFLYAAYSWIQFLNFLIYSANLCLLIGMFRPFTIKVIIDMLALYNAILLFSFYLFPLVVVALYSFYLPFCRLFEHVLGFHLSL